jgi:hypothetical protein
MRSLFLEQYPGYPLLPGLFLDEIRLFLEKIPLLFLEGVVLFLVLFLVHTYF